VAAQNKKLFGRELGACYKKEIYDLIRSVLGTILQTRGGAGRSYNTVNTATKTKHAYVAICIDRLTLRVCDREHGRRRSRQRAFADAFSRI
jgi:hypothetical protein